MRCRSRDAPSCERLGKRPVYIAAGVVGAIGGLGVAVVPGSAPAAAIALWGVVGIGLGVINTLIFALQADTVDYGDWKSGVRAQAKLSSGPTIANSTQYLPGSRMGPATFTEDSIS